MNAVEEVSEQSFPPTELSSNMSENELAQNNLSSTSSKNVPNVTVTQSEETPSSETQQVSGEEHAGDKKENISCNDLSQTMPSETKNITEESSESEDWLDIIGSGDFKKKIIEPGAGIDSRPKRGDIVVVHVTYYNNKGDLIEQQERFQFIISDLDVIQGLDLAVNLMEVGEKAKVLIPSRLAYGKLGRKPDFPPDCDLSCDVELLDVKEVDETSLSLSERLDIGIRKRNRGNFFYERDELISAVHCYERASEYIDAIHDSSDNSNEELQTVVDTRIKIYNNLAATHLKLEAFDSALKSVDLVIRIQSKNVKAHFRKGKILSAKGLTDEAIVSMKTAANLEPDSKVIQNEITKLINKKKKEDTSQKEMYKRMFKQETSKSKGKASASLIKKWSLFAGGVLALAFSMLAYRQYHS